MTPPVRFEMQSALETFHPGAESKEICDANEYDSPRSNQLHTSLKLPNRVFGVFENMVETLFRGTPRPLAWITLLTAFWPPSRSIKVI